MYCRCFPGVYLTMSIYTNMIIGRYFIALSFSLIFVNDVYAEGQNIEFHGQREVTPKQAPTKQKIQFHRRMIAPPIPQESLKNSEINEVVESTIVHQKPFYTLTRNESLLAKKASYYFEQNWYPKTGLWNSVSGYSHVTMWDVASGIAAALALEALNLETSEVTVYRLQKTLNTLNKLPLYKGVLPNREYNSKTGQPSGRLSQNKSHGNGWSALDIGRLLIWLNILQKKHPDFKNDVENIVSKWQLNRAIYKDTLYGTKLYKGKEYYRQEGRNGYLQYAAKGFQLFDFKVNLSNEHEYLESIKIDNITAIRDTRNVPFFTSDPYVLAALEFGKDPIWDQLDTIYSLHKNQWHKTNTLTSYGEDAMNKNPWFAYNNIYYYKKPWTSVSPSGKVIENPQLLSHKVAFGFSVLFDDEFSKALHDTVIDNSLQFRNIPTGVYQNGGINKAFNINTNSLILVSLWYKSLGFTSIHESLYERD